MHAISEVAGDRRSLDRHGWFRFPVDATDSIRHPPRKPSGNNPRRDPRD